jgi:hypothetical protein
MTFNMIYPANSPNKIDMPTAYTRARNAQGTALSQLIYG